MKKQKKSSFEPINYLKDDIGKRVEEQRTKRSLSKQAAIKENFEGTEVSVSNNSTTVALIERGEYRNGFTTFITDQTLETLAKNLYGNVETGKFKIIYGSEEDLSNFIAKIYERVIYNFPAKDDIDGNEIDSFKETIPELVVITKKIIDTLFSNVEFTYKWYKDMELTLTKDVKTVNDLYFPAYLSVETQNLYLEATSDFFKKIKNQLIESYRNEFIADNKISIKNFNERVLSWILNIWPSIIEAEYKNIKDDFIQSIGYEAKPIIHKHYELVKMQVLKTSVDLSILGLRRPEYMSDYWRERNMNEKGKELYKRAYNRKLAAIKEARSEVIPDLENKFEEISKKLIYVQKDMNDFWPMDYDSKISLNRPQLMPTDIYGQDYYYDRHKLP